MTLPGIIEDPGSLAGRVISPSPALGPEAKNLISFDILNSDVASPLRALDKLTKESCAAIPSNLFEAGL